MKYIDSLISLFTGERLIAKGKNFFLVSKSDKIILKYRHGLVYSEINTKSLYTNAYYDYFIPLPALYDRARILVIGLGIGTIPLQLHNVYSNNIELSSVESDKEIIDISKRYLSGINIDIINDDGAAYIKERDKAYDLIILDAFVGEEIPKQFRTDQFVSEAFNRLSNNGILAINSIIQYKEYEAIIKNHFKLYKLELPSNLLNKILLCTKSIEHDQISKIAQNMQPRVERRIIKAYKSIKTV